MRTVLGMSVLVLAMATVSAAEDAEVRDLIKKLQSKDSDVRRSAAKSLKELGAGGKLAIPALRKALKDRDLFVRRFCAEALGAMGVVAKDAVPELTVAMRDDRKEMQLAAVEALTKMGPSAIQSLIGTVKDTSRDAAVRRKAAEGLGKIGKQARGAVRVFTDVLTGKIKTAKVGKKNKNKGNDEDIRVEVATALGKVARPEDKQALEALKGLTEGKKAKRNRALKQAAANAIREINGMPPKTGKKKKKNDQ